jgi:hypothetical protein
MEHSRLQFATASHKMKPLDFAEAATRRMQPAPLPAHLLTSLIKKVHTQVQWSQLGARVLQGPDLFCARVFHG